MASIDDSLPNPLFYQTIILEYDELFIDLSNVGTSFLKYICIVEIVGELFQ